MNFRRVCEAREPRRQLVENALPRPLLALSALPQIHDACRVVGDGVAVDVRMPRDELFALAARDDREVDIRRFLEELREEHGLEQQVAEFVGLVIHIAGRDGLDDFECLVHGVRDDRRSRLLAVPRARDAQVGADAREARHLGADRALTEACAIRDGGRVRTRAGEAMSGAVGRDDHGAHGDVRNWHLERLATNVEQRGDIRRHVDREHMCATTHRIHRGHGYRIDVAGPEPDDHHRHIRRWANVHGVAGVVPAAVVEGAEPGVVGVAVTSWLCGTRSMLEYVLRFCHFAIAASCHFA